MWQALSAPEYERKKQEVGDALVKRVEAFLPGLTEATVFREVGTPRTHRRFLSRWRFCKFFGAGFLSSQSMRFLFGVPVGSVIGAYLILAANFIAIWDPQQCPARKKNTYMANVVSKHESLVDAERTKQQAC